MEQLNIRTIEVGAEGGLGENYRHGVFFLRAVAAVDDNLVEKMDRKFDLSERLIVFASDIIDITEKLPMSLAGSHLALSFSGVVRRLHCIMVKRRLPSLGRIFYIK